MQMRKKDYILAINFPAQVKNVINETIESYKPEITSVLSKAEKVLYTAKTAEKFEKNQNKEENRGFEMEL